MMVIGSRGLSILLLPPCDVVQLPLLSLCEKVWELGLLQRMPVVEHPVWGDDLTLKGASAGTLAD